MFSVTIVITMQGQKNNDQDVHIQRGEALVIILAAK